MHVGAGPSDLAVPMYLTLLADCERVLGQQTQTPSPCGELADTYLDDGRRDLAIALYEKALAECGPVLGSNHHITDQIRRGLQDAREYDHP